MANPSDKPTEGTRLIRVLLALFLLAPVTTLFGLIGGLLLTVLYVLGGTDPTTDDGEPLPKRLVEWFERNRRVLATDGDRPLAWRP